MVAEITVSDAAMFVTVPSKEACFDYRTTCIYYIIEVIERISQ